MRENNIDKWWLYSPRLAARFVSDFDMPFPVTFNEELFHGYVYTFNETHWSLDKYHGLCNEIRERFDGDIDKFLADFYDTRERIIVTMSGNEALKSFNSMDMKSYDLGKAVKPNVSNKGIYNCYNIGKRFLSIDLRQANFNALRYVDPSIVYDKDRYEDFIGKFTDSPYFVNSKHVRQVIFGQLNPKRHITVEKYLINEVRIAYELTNFIKDKGRLVSMVTDELIYEIDDDWDCQQGLDCFVENMTKGLHIPIKAETFRLSGYEFILKSQQKTVNVFYSKSYDADAPTILRCVPLQYSCIAYRLLWRQPVTYNDMCFTHDGILSKFEEEFELRPIPWKNAANPETDKERER